VSRSRKALAPLACLAFQNLLLSTWVMRGISPCLRLIRCPSLTPHALSLPCPAAFLVNCLTSSLPTVLVMSHCPQLCAFFLPVVANLPIGMFCKIKNLSVSAVISSVKAMSPHPAVSPHGSFLASRTTSRCVFCAVSIRQMMLPRL
jgi:hypothetical protein